MDTRRYDLEFYIGQRLNVSLLTSICILYFLSACLCRSSDRFYWQHHARWYNDYTKVSILYVSYFILSSLMLQYSPPFLWHFTSFRNDTSGFYTLYRRIMHLPTRYRIYAHSDNGATNWNVAEASARGITLEIDQDAMTATFVNEYLPIDTVENYSVSQGSVQVRLLHLPVKYP